MKFSTLAQVYDRIAEARNDSQRVKLLADIFKGADKKTLEEANTLERLIRLYKQSH